MLGTLHFLAPKSSGADDVDQTQTTDSRASHKQISSDDLAETRRERKLEDFSPDELLALVPKLTMINHKSNSSKLFKLSKIENVAVGVIDNLSGIGSAETPLKESNKIIERVADEVKLKSVPEDALESCENEFLLRPRMPQLTLRRKRNLNIRERKRSESGSSASSENICWNLEGLNLISDKNSNESSSSQIESDIKDDLYSYNLNLPEKHLSSPDEGILWGDETEESEIEENTGKGLKIAFKLKPASNQTFNSNGVGYSTPLENKNASLSAPTSSLTQKTKDSEGNQKSMGPYFTSRKGSNFPSQSADKSNNDSKNILSGLLSDDDEDIDWDDTGVENLIDKPKESEEQSTKIVESKPSNLGKPTTGKIGILSNSKKDENVIYQKRSGKLKKDLFSFSKISALPLFSSMKEKEIKKNESNLKSLSPKTVEINALMSQDFTRDILWSAEDIKVKSFKPWIPLSKRNKPKSFDKSKFFSGNFFKDEEKSSSGDTRIKFFGKVNKYRGVLGILNMKPNAEEVKKNFEQQILDRKMDRFGGDVELDENGNKIKKRKTKEEKIAAKEFRLNRLRNMGLILKKDSSADKIFDFSEASGYQWKKQIQSMPSLNTHFVKGTNDQDSSDFLLDLKNGEKISLDVKSILSSGSNNSSAFSGKKDLTCSSGDITALEYFEKEIPLIASSGSPFSFVNFLRRKFSDQKERQRFVDEEASIEFKKRGVELGYPVILDSNDKSPFLATLSLDKIYQSILNEAFVAPVKLMKNPDVHLIVKQKNEKCFLKGIKHLVLIGQTEPQIESFFPDSTTKNPELGVFLQSYISYNILRRMNRNKKGSIMLQEVKTMFPHVSETIIMKSINSVCKKAGHVFVKKDGSISEMDFKKQISLSDIARFDSTQSYIFKHNLKRFPMSFRLDPLKAELCLSVMNQIQDKLKLAMQSLTSLTGGIYTQEDELEIDRQTLEWITRAVLLSPWSWTTGFVNMHMRRGQPNNRYDKVKMRVTHRGESFNADGNLVSYLPEQDPLSKIFQVKGKKMNREEEFGDLAKGFGGTEYDLRKLSLQEGEKFLLAFGIPKEIIQKLDRWDRIMVVEDKASSPEGRALMNENFKGFSRNIPKAREEAEKQRMEIQRKVDEKFEKHISVLMGEKKEGRVDVDIVDETDKIEVEGDSDDDFGDDLLEGLETEEEEEAENEEVLEKSNDQGAFSRRRKVLRRVMISTNSKGEIISRIIFLKNPKEVENFRIKLMRERRTQVEDRRRESGVLDFALENQWGGNTVTRSPVYGGSNQQGDLFVENLEKKLKEKEKSRKLFVEYQENIKKYGENWPLTVEGKHRCSVCRLPGHKANSKKCPLLYAKVKSTHNELKSGPFKVKIKLGEKASNLQGGNGRRGRVTSRRHGAHHELSLILEKVLNELNNLPFTYHFRQKVSRKHYPQYYTMIKKPMDLGTMKGRNELYTYESVEQFMQDLRQIESNSVQFNGPTHWLSESAKKMIESAESVLEPHLEELKELKEKIQATKQVSSKRKRRKKEGGVSKKTKIEGDRKASFGSDTMPSPMSFSMSSPMAVYPPRSPGLNSLNSPEFTIGSPSSLNLADLVGTSQPAGEDKRDTDEMLKELEGQAEIVEQTEFEEEEII